MLDSTESMSTIQTPLSSYEAWIKHGRLERNPEQEAVLSYLTQVQRNLTGLSAVLRKITRWIKVGSPVQGLYLWGGLGVGKTLMMDFFYETLPLPKFRAHFHAFMRRVHEELRERQGQVNPLTSIGRRLAQQYRVICFDEFFVVDVGDAMLLAELLRVLFENGVCLMTTSNFSPDRLYEHGLQRDRFLPAIDLIYRHTKVWHLSLEHDYRRRALEKIPVYYTPLGEESEHGLWDAMQRFADDLHLLSQTPVSLYGREIPVKQRTEKMIWFEFRVICGRPRSPSDYLALVQKYQMLFISNIPCLERAPPDQIVSFIHLIDILYDAKVPLIMSAETPIEKLYTKGAFRALFQRTESRLIEMQTKEYLQRTKVTIQKN